MKLIKNFLVILFSSTFFCQTASALEFTYSNLDLRFLQGYLGGEPSDLVGNNEPPFPTFSISFNSTPENFHASFVSGDLTIQQPNGDSFEALLLEDVPASNSSITFNQDGSISAWNFSLALTQTSPQTIDNPGGTSSWLVDSSYGDNTCNCDRYKSIYDIHTQRPYNTWQYVNTLGVLFGSETSPANWSYDNIQVPEPTTYLLLLSGLAIIGLTRFRKTMD